MILNTETVEQVVDREERAFFVKELVVARGPASIAMVRKRSAQASGTRATLMLIHGYGQNRYAWHLPSRSFANYLARAGFDVFSLDLRGHGRSSHLGAHRPKSAEDYVHEDVPTAVEEVQRINRGAPVWLVGHSLGGLISYAVAPRLGGSIAGIATIGSPYHFTRGTRALAWLGSLLLMADEAVRPRAGMGFPLAVWGEAMRIGRAFVESPVFPLPFRGFAPGSMERAVYEQHMALAMDRASLDVMRQMFRSAMHRQSHGLEAGGLEGFEDAFEALDLPLLVIAGQKDDLAPPASVKPAYDRSRSHDKTYRLFPAGHIDLLVGKDAPYTVWPALEAWLRKRT